MNNNEWSVCSSEMQFYLNWLAIFKHLMHINDNRMYGTFFRSTHRKQYDIPICFCPIWLESFTKMFNLINLASDQFSPNYPSKSVSERIEKESTMQLHNSAFLYSADLFHRSGRESHCTNMWDFIKQTGSI